VTEDGLYLDLARMLDDSIRRALQVNHSWDTDSVYICSETHRMHTVCGTLEALGYTQRVYVVGEHKGQSAWRLTNAGMELYEDLRKEHKRRRRLS
jgi:hypothetical protein